MKKEKILIKTMVMTLIVLIFLLGTLAVTSKYVENVTTMEKPILHENMIIIYYGNKNGVIGIILEVCSMRHDSTEVWDKARISIHAGVCDNYEKDINFIRNI